MFKLFLLVKNRKKAENLSYVEMPKESNEILIYNHGEKSMKVTLISYANLEPLLEKISTCQNNPKNLSTTK